MSTKLNIIAIQLCVPTSQAECFVNQVNQYLPRKVTCKAISMAIRSLPLPDRSPMSVAAQLLKEHQLLPDNRPTKDETPVTHTQAAPLAQEYTLRVVGVTFDGRQAVVAKLTSGEPVALKREPTNPYDRNAIMVVRLTGEQFGYIDRFTAARIAYRLDRLGCGVNGAVTRISGMSYPHGSLGVQIRFGLPIEAEEI